MNKKIKTLLIITFSVIIAGFSVKVGSIKSTAASAYSGGIDYSAVFDAAYYSKTYKDLKAAFGNNENALFNHFLSYGMKEGRDANGVFDLSYYKNKYPDLRNAFGNNNEAYYVHFITCGVYEGRRPGNSFDWFGYAQTYNDLRNAFGNNVSSYYFHYITCGKKEGRIANSTSFYNGKDYSLVYNKDYYLNNYSDLRAVFGDDAQSLITHFITYGMKEGRRANIRFDFNYYKNAYPDLQAAFGSDNTAYYTHYMQFGYNEGRYSSEKLIGIDVSKNKGTIDWEKVKADGIQFAIIRVGYGSNIEKQHDPQAIRNMSECERLGIPYGVYLYSYAKTVYTVDEKNPQSADSEADHVLGMIKGFNPTLGVWYDIEDASQNSLTNDQLKDIAMHFLGKVENAGYDAGVYANLYFWKTRLTSEDYNQYNRWVAQWNDKCTYTGDYIMWQYTNSGTVNGINGNVDMNIYYFK